MSASRNWPARISFLFAVFFLYGAGFALLLAANDWNAYLTVFAVVGIGFLLRVAYLRLGRHYEPPA